MAYGEPQWWQQWAANTTDYSYTYPIYTTGSSSSVQMQVYPAMVAVPSAEPEPEDDSPLAWLRGQVSEITELAQAA